MLPGLGPAVAGASWTPYDGHVNSLQLFHALHTGFAARGGAYLHPRHNWFVSAALTGDDLALVLEATDQAFAAVRKHLGQ